MNSSYRNQNGSRSGQSGPSYPNLSKDRNPLQTVRDTYRQPQEDSYKMQPGEFMPVVQNEVASDSRATVRAGGVKSGDQNFDVRSQSFGSLDDNMRTQWVDASSDIPDRK